MRQINYHIALLLFLVQIVSGQTQRITGGSISGSHSWSGTVLISGDVTVELNSRLLIEPGTEILFEANKDLTRGGKDKTRSELIVRGTLLARGLPGKPILFSSAAKEKRMGDWYGIEFLHLKAGSIFDHCVVEYAYTGLAVKNSNIQISNTESRLNYHVGIKTEVKAAPLIKNSILSENGYAGLICELGSKPVLSGNVISMNRIGVVVFSLAQPNLGSMAQNDENNPGQNRIFNNEEYNLYNHSSKPILAENNFWGEGVADNKIFDKASDARYGSVDYQPVLRTTRPLNMENLLLLAQEPAPVPERTASTVVSNETPDLADASNNASSDSSMPVGDLVVADTATSDMALVDTLEENLFSISKDLEEAGPLIASNAPPEPTVNEVVVGDESSAQAEIDYDRIYMEMFLDGGQKGYIHKPKLRITNVLKNVLQVGEVRLRVIVGKSGEVINATILRGVNEILDEAVLSLVRKYRYKPGTVNNQSVRFSTSEVFRFE